MLEKVLVKKRALASPKAESEITAINQTFYEILALHVVFASSKNKLFMELFVSN